MKIMQPKKTDLFLFSRGTHSELSNWMKKKKETTTEYLEKIADETNCAHIYVLPNGIF